MYAEAGRWGEADKIRELMKLRRVQKTPGCSWVQIQDKVHAFIVGQRLEGLDPCLSLENTDSFVALLATFGSGKLGKVQALSRTRTERMDQELR
ncbi:hypothetical protein FXO38_36123 [Capsicum annuum]|nr:hypothetical protein FXO38_36123 [Capsicum annuum]